LTGTIAPTDATNQTIVWSVKDAGTTGASISDENKLTATAAGTVKVTATIAGGQAVGTDYTQDFDITVADPFIAVTNITGVPAAMWVNTLLTLTSTVAPANATNKTIVWSVKDVGTTSASISDENKLTATAAGTATVTATIANGSAQGTDYTQDFTIKVTADLTWMAATVSSSGFGTTTNINGVAYGGSGTSARFIAVGDSGKMASSLNGTSWTAVSNSRFGTANIGGVAYGGGKFVAGKGDGNTNLTIASSTSGTSWTLANLATNPNYTVVNNMAYINSTFVAGGIGSIGYSSDGTTDWDVYGIGVSNSISINGVAYGGPAGQEQWVAVGNNGTMRYASSLTVTWASTYGSTIFDTTNVNGVAYGGSGTSARFIAVGDSGKMASSLNGRLWTTVSDSTFGTTNIRGVAYGGGKFVAFGANGKIAYSNLQE
jgi:hypothetical protein